MTLWTLTRSLTASYNDYIPVFAGSYTHYTWVSQNFVYNMYAWMLDLLSRKERGDYSSHRWSQVPRVKENFREEASLKRIFRMRHGIGAVWANILLTTIWSSCSSLFPPCMMSQHIMTFSQAELLKLKSLCAFKISLDSNSLDTNLAKMVFKNTVYTWPPEYISLSNSNSWDLVRSSCVKANSHQEMPTFVAN